ncbi:MAG: hypothetical protein A2Z20_07755 [Bdellovibrionales bacterium RBG_16_40_8]|nr:MAG: hypothetical protein A2Z20_07755 [Bdellovibrionales bacterium RBG_16_40_8]
MKVEQTTRNKALAINKSANFYGSFAEIGAGQEVARHFFQAGFASQTVAKSMSAYDKTFSDAIYGKGSRFVSEERLIKMLNHEYELLEERLSEKKQSVCFFSYANTVATSSHEEVPSCHGWMGIRFQKRPGGPTNDLLIHVRMLDRLRLQQQEALGALGVNLIYIAFHYVDTGNPELITSFLDNLTTDRIEINFIRFSGPDVEHIDNRLMSLELVKQDLTRAILFSPNGESLSMADSLYKKNILLQRGRFRPVTLTNVKIIEKGMAQMLKNFAINKDDIVVIMEMTMSHLTDSGDNNSGNIDKKDFLDRVDTLCALGNYVMVSNFPLFWQLRYELRRFSDKQCCMVIGAYTLPGLFDKNLYAKSPWGILSALGHLFDESFRLYVYPYKTEKECMTAKTFSPPEEIANIYKHVLENKFIVDIENCDDIDTSLHSEIIQKLLSADNPKWESLVPESTCRLIKTRKLFGYKG